MVNDSYLWSQITTLSSISPQSVQIWAVSYEGTQLLWCSIHIDKRGDTSVSMLVAYVWECTKWHVSVSDWCSALVSILYMMGYHDTQKFTPECVCFTVTGTCLTNTLPPFVPMCMGLLSSLVCNCNFNCKTYSNQLLDFYPSPKINF